jgi:NifU-like protein involved in Fe-S cluster formation
LEYSPEVERYFREPVNLGSAESLAPHQIQGEAGSVERGTWIIIQARVEAGQLEAVRFLAYGCPHTIAACCRTTEKLAGAPVGELLNFAPDWLTDELTIPVEKAGKLLILQDALRECFDGWQTVVREHDGNYVDG